MKEISRSHISSGVVVLAALLLAGCQTTGSTAKTGSLANQRVAGAMAAAARDAASSGRIEESLAINRKLYLANPNDKAHILAYARDLRRAGRIDDARLVIRTPSLGSDATPAMQTEAAMVLIAAGDYSEARQFAEKAIAAAPASPDAYQALALAQSGEGNHEDAEAAFSKAFTLWPNDRDKTSVINNLAVSQLAQGKVTEAGKTMSMATGEALKSEVYQNNRSYLKTLRDLPVAAKENTAAEVMPAVTISTVDSEAMEPETVLIVAKPERKPVVADLAVSVSDEDVLSAETYKLEPASGSATGPTPLFDDGYGQTKKKSLTGLTPLEPHNRRFGLNN